MLKAGFMKCINTFYKREMLNSILHKMPFLRSGELNRHNLSQILVRTFPATFYEWCQPLRQKSFCLSPQHDCNRQWQCKLLHSLFLSVLIWKDLTGFIGILTLPLLLAGRRQIKVAHYKLIQRSICFLKQQLVCQIAFRLTTTFWTINSYPPIINSRTPYFYTWPEECAAFKKAYLSLFQPCSQSKQRYHP